MNHKEWIGATLAHRQPPRVPYNFMFSPPARAAVEKHYGTAALEDVLDFPLRMSAPKSIKPLYSHPSQFGPTVTDEFGVVWSTTEIDRGSPVGPPLREPDLSRFKWPDPTAEYRFEDLGKWTAANAGHFTIIWIGDLWERATFMRGMEALLFDLTLAPRFVEQLLRGLADHILRTMGILFDRFTFDGVALSDDYGTQHGLLMSPDHWRRFIRPLVREIYSLAKRRGRRVFHHSCGNIVPIIGDMIDAGLDILHPIQPEAMDIVALKRDFGRDLTFCGGVRTQDLLPCGTPGEVRDEVRRLKDVMGAGGGYILEPGITLQADVPVANMAAMIDEARAE
ncbi:MAG: uroporphyrinogen decarboxylase family protein [Phycisphaerae bacterium]